MKYLAMIQARCGSARLPDKVLKDLCGKPQLQRVIERVKKSRYTDEVMVVTSIDRANLPILGLCAGIGIRAGTGSEEDVLDRYYQNAKLLEPEYVIRITGDCPCIDPGIIDAMILQTEEDPDIDYCSNTVTEDMADGLDVEIMKFEALERSWREARHSSEREHVTQYILKHPEIFRVADYPSPAGDFGGHRWTVDEPEDLELVRQIYDHFLNDLGQEDFSYLDILDFLGKHPQIQAVNGQYRRNEGLEKSVREDRICVPEEWGHAGRHQEGGRGKWNAESMKTEKDSSCTGKRKK